MNGIVLAGGKSSRFGRNKALVVFEGQTLIERSVALLRSIFLQVYIATNSPEIYADLGVEMVTDLYQNCGPLGGIHAGLLASSSHSNFIAACDMPFLNRNLINYLAESSEGYDLVVPRFFGKPHPLCAVYTKDCLPQVEKQLKAGDLKLTNLISSVNSKIVDEEEVKRFDFLGRSLVNINTLQDLKKVTRNSPHLPCLPAGRNVGNNHIHYAEIS